MSEKATLSREKMDTLVRLLNKVEAAQRELGAFENECVLDAPAKVGDTVEVTGYSHRGKPMLVESVSLRRSFGQWEFVAFGRVLKKDGSPSQHRAKTFYRVESE